MEPPRRLHPSVPKGEPSHRAAPAPALAARRVWHGAKSKCEPQDKNTGPKDAKTRPPMLQRKISVKLETRTRVQETGGIQTPPQASLSGPRARRRRRRLLGVRDSADSVPGFIRSWNPGDPGLLVSEESGVSSAPPPPTPPPTRAAPQGTNPPSGIKQAAGAPAASQRPLH